MNFKRIVFFISFAVLVCCIHTKAYAQLHLLKDNKTCLYGYTNEAGEWIVPAQYVYAEEFSDKNYAVVGNGDKTGLLDTTGTFILPLIYDQIVVYYRENYYLLKNDSTYSIFDVTDKKVHYKNFLYPITQYKNSYVIFQKGAYYGLAFNEKIVFDNVYHINNNVYTQVAIVHHGPYNNDSLRLYDLQKNAFISEDFYNWISLEGENHYLVRKHDRYGMIDKTGKIAIPFSYSALYSNSYSHPILVMRNVNNKGYDVYSLTGKKLNRKPYPYIDTVLVEKNLYIISKNKKFGILKADGTLGLPCIYDSITHLEWNNIYLLYQDKGIHVSSNEGVILNKKQYKNICFPSSLFKPDEETPHSAYYEEQLPLIVNIWNDSSVSIIIIDSLKEHTTGDGYEMETDIRLYANEKYGFLSTSLNYILPPAYDMIFPFETDQYSTSILNEERFGIMSRNGEVVIEPEYLFIEQNPFSDSSFIFMSEENLFGIKNSEGDILIQPVYTALSGYDPEHDYCWAQHIDSTELRLIDRNEELKSLYDFAYPVSLSLEKNTIVRVRVSDVIEEVYKTGVLDCSTLLPVIPFVYEKIAALNDSMYLCMMEENYTNSTHLDLYIHDMRIDSVTGISILPENIIAIERNYNWGYFRDGAWLIRPTKKPLGYILDERSVIQMQSQTFAGLSYEDFVDYEITIEFYTTATSNPLSHSLNNEILWWYCNDQKLSFNNIYMYEDTENIPVLYTNDYVTNVIESKDDEYEEYYYGNSNINTSTSEIIYAVIHSASFAEIRFRREYWNRYASEIIHDNKQYTITNTNQLKQLSLADITNHPQYKALLSALINIHLDSLEDIQLPCTDRDNIIELTKGYQFEKEGLRFYFKDERYEYNNFEEQEIEALIPYSELMIYFKKSVYISLLYRNSIK
ncbi:WG repeat-containing protein [Cytophaga aurantiaca]|uniref:WG repeat-containing protein n=1 Tax=Cytophaga aurantiaca TaxID=29530 RepID=UPI00037A9634|nr:WG repeat-containing protein [Cytophaga aurantiaca]